MCAAGAVHETRLNGGAALYLDTSGVRLVQRCVKNARAADLLTAGRALSLNGGFSFRESRLTGAPLRASTQILVADRISPVESTGGGGGGGLIDGTIYLYRDISAAAR